MDKIDKFLSKLDRDDRLTVLDVLKLIREGKIADLNIKKLKGYENMFRVRVGRYRIIFIKENGIAEFIKISNRDDTTYNL